MYYTRLTQVSTDNIGDMDPRKGKIIAETGATGRFILNEVTWKSAVAPNAESFTAFMQEGELKIIEPLGARFLDYLRFAAIELGIVNHNEARYILEIEFISQEDIDGPPLKYAWPIMFISTDGRINEKGSEYTIRFVNMGQHAMNSQTQSIKETMAVNDVSTLKEYFTGLGTILERQEFIYAKAGQKAGKPAPWPGGDHPAASDNYHDEYYFVIDPRMEDWTFTTKGKADPVKKGSMKLFSSSKFNVEARAGTPLNQQITKVIASTNQADRLYTENYAGGELGGDAPKSSTSGSKTTNAGKPDLKDIMGKIYNFVRVETYTVYKKYDYVRGRYACKHIFYIWLALQPNLFQYPDELDALNLKENKGLVINKLKSYLQEGLLSKWYYFTYTGLNTEILKLDIQYNNAYYLPSFPVIFADREKTGFGEQNPWNNSRRINPYAKGKESLVINSRIQQLEQELRQLKSQPSDSGSELRRKIKEKALEELKSRRDAASSNANAAGAPTDVKDRTQLLNALADLYIEDVDYRSGLAVSLDYADMYPSLRPMMAPDGVVSISDDKRSEAEAIMDKIFNVALQAKDLLMLDMDVRGDPYWFGPPNMGVSGKTFFDDIDMPPAMKAKVNNFMPNIDPKWNDRKFDWGGGMGDHANFYKGGNLVYLHMQLPNSDYGEQAGGNVEFDLNDSVIGIYQIQFIEHAFRDGRFTQNVKGVRDMTIPSQFIPRSNVSETSTGGMPTDTTWENFVQEALSSDTRAMDDIRQQKIKANTERLQQQSDVGVGGLTGAGGTVAGIETQAGMGAAGLKPATATTGLNEDVKTAYAGYKAGLDEIPKGSMPAVQSPVAHATELVKQGYTKEAAYTKALETYKDQTGAYFGKLNEVSAENYKGNTGDAIKDYKLYDPAAMVKKAGDGGLSDWKSGNTARPGPWALNNPAGLGADAKTGRANQYPTLEEGLKAQHEYYNYGAGVPVGSTSAGGTKLPDRYMLPTSKPTFEYSNLTGTYKQTGTTPVDYTVQQQVDYIDQQTKTTPVSMRKRI